MCFSPEASFVGGIVISAIGVATVTKVHQSSQLVCAIIPLFFGVQQITEGVLWMTLPNPDYVSIQKFSTYLFLIMADVLWPLMIPLSVLLMGKSPKKKKTLILFLILGACLSAYFATCLVLFNVNPEIMRYHIQYHTEFQKSLALITFAIYLTVTITPLFISSIRKTHFLGILMFLSCAVTAVFFTQFITSGWCFFAAIISSVMGKFDFSRKVVTL